MSAMEIMYQEREDGLLYPVLEVEEENLSTLGKYGMLAMEYLKENHKTRYQSLLRFGRLTEKLKEVEEEANQMLDHLMQSYLKNHPPKDRHSTMEMWKIRQQGMMMAEEIVMKEIVNQYH